MKIFITGANGFIGSHILDILRDAGMEVRLLLRETSDTSFIEHHLPNVEVYTELWKILTPSAMQWTAWTT